MFTDGGENQKYARLCGDLRAAAEAELMSPLKNAGATPEAASEACVNIAASIAQFLMQKDGAHYPFDEIGQIRETLVELEAKLSRLSLLAEGVMQDYLWDETEKTKQFFDVEIWVKHQNWQNFQRFRDALPKIVESLPTKPSHKRGHDNRRHRAIRYAILDWGKATGHLPPATKTAAGEGTAPLLVFLQRQLGTDGISADSFRRVILKLKPRLDLPRGA